MSYAATVLRVMIASPSDVQDARDAVERAVHSWNDANAKNKGVILQPWRWETSAVPVLGAHPQRLINAQGVDNSDIVFAMFAGGSVQLRPMRSRVPLKRSIELSMQVSRSTSTSRLLACLLM